jgi:hypothetical protein
MERHFATVIVATATVTLMAMTCVADELDEGILSGTIVYDGHPYPEPDVASLPIGKVRNETLLVNPENGGVASVVVSLTPIASGKAASHTSKDVVIRATDTGFSPHVVALHPADTLQIINTGKFGTIINLASRQNEPINKVLPPGDQLAFTPSNPERWPISLTCNIKPWMLAWVVVSASPHVAVSDERGRFQFRDIEAGNYDVTIWHERIGAVKDSDLKNPAFNRTARGYQLRLERRSSDLGRIALEARLFGSD